MGGAIASQTTTPLRIEYERCDFAQNRAGGYGGAVSSFGSVSQFFTSCVLDSNKASLFGEPSCSFAVY